MRRKHCLQLLIVVAVLLLPGDPIAGEGTQPAKDGFLAGGPYNLLFILTDQQRRDTMKAYGNDRIVTPNLDGLAAQSYVFERAYVTQPVCSPGRASLLTGLYPHSNGVTSNNIPLRRDTPVLVEMLRSREYVSAWYGKWHLGDEIFKQHGFDYFESTESYAAHWLPGRDKAARSQYDDFLARAGIRLDGPDGQSRHPTGGVPKELSKSAFVAKRGIEFLDANKGAPFVLSLSFTDPTFSAREHREGRRDIDGNLYPPSDMAVPETFFEKLDPSVLERTKARRRSFDSGTTRNYERIIETPENLQKVKAQYWAKITLVDEMVGRVLDHLKKLGLYDKTIIAFTSDHGEMMGDHRLLFKEQMYEGSSTVPLLLKLPAQKETRRVVGPVSHVDLVPTLLNLMGEPVPVWLQGRSWSPHLLKGARPPRRDVVVQWNEHSPEERRLDRVRMIVTQNDWKMSLAHDSHGELYDLGQDPRERTNLFYRIESLPTIEQLVWRLNLWQRSVGDELLDFDEREWRKHVRRYDRGSAEDEPR